MLPVSYSEVRPKKTVRLSGSVDLPGRNLCVVVPLAPKPMKSIGQEPQESNDLLLRLNELAKHRPFNIIYKVKRHDPL